MRVTYPVLDYIRKVELDHRYLRSFQNTIDYVDHLHKKSDHYKQDIISLYNRQADIKRYDNRIHIDIFV